MPLLNIMAEFDHLVPNEASIPLNDAVSSKEKEMLVFPRTYRHICWVKIPERSLPIDFKWLRQGQVLMGKEYRDRNQET